jgi:hypothetical protein
MPRGDGTGPAGQGPLTGRGMGYCAGFSMPGFMNFGFGGFGRGLGFGRGFGRGSAWKARFFQPVMQPQALTEAEEKKILQEELEILKEEMKEIQKRLKEIE